MPGHALHSPNLTKHEMRQYLSSRQPPRNRHSLVEASEHDPYLVKYLQSPLDPRLIQEIIKTAEKVIRIPSDLLAPGAPLTPPVTPVKSMHSQQAQASSKNGATPIHLSPKWKPLDQFVIRLIEASNVRVATLAYALIVLDRLKEKLPPLAQGMQCTRHRIFLAALIVASKYLNDSTPKNRHWNYYSKGLFDTCEITLMEKQMLGLLDFDLRITEAQLVARLSHLIHPTPATNLMAPAVRNGGVSLKPAQPRTPITPITPTTVKAPVAATEPTIRGSATEKEDTFVLQPVPAIKKRGDKQSSNVGVAQRTVSFSASQSAPSDMAIDELNNKKNGSVSAPALALPNLPKIDLTKETHVKSSTPVKGSVAMPFVRSFSSDGLLEGTGSMAMHAARTFSSTMLASSSISASSSTSQSEVSTPGDRSSAWVDESSNQHYFHSQVFGEQSRTFRLRRGSESAMGSMSLPTLVVKVEGEGGNAQSGLMNKLIGVGKSLSPTRRVGHGIKGDRKVSTATIVPDEVHLEH